MGLNDDLKEKLMIKGRELGFPVMKVTRAESMVQWENEIERRKKLDPATADSWERRRMTAEPQDLLPGARSIVLLVHPYKPYPQTFPTGMGGYSAHYKEYPIGRDAAKVLAAVLEEHGSRVLVDPPLPIKLIAQRIGAGSYGRNGLIHTRGFGSWITLHVLLTDADLPEDTAEEKISDCGSCDKCIRACPTGAIDVEGAVILSRCLRYHMGSSDFIPVELREKLGTRMLGCDACQAGCPWNHKALEQIGAPSAEELEPFDIKAILAEWKEGLKPRLARMGAVVGQNYARAQRVLTTAVILAGNTGDKDYIPLLKQTLRHPHPPVRGHSAWALGRLGGAASADILRQALLEEKDSRVRDEINNALLHIL